MLSVFATPPRETSALVVIASSKAGVYRHRGRRRSSPRRLGFEPLEDRALLAGMLTLEIAPDSIIENAGPAAATATVTRSNAETKLTAGDGAAYDHFGGVVSISGTTAIVGARYDDDKGGNSGSASIFEQSGGTWRQVVKLTASDGTAGDEFGCSVSISGTTAIVGGYSGSASGAAYVFEQSGGTWFQVAKLTPSDGAAWDWFGSSVSVSGTTAIVGAWGNDDNGSSSGAAYIFEQSGGVWSEVAKLTATDADPNDRFGGAVSISGTTAIVGAGYDDDQGVDSGSAYVFEQSAGTWTQVAKLTASDGAANSRFGETSVSISGTTAIAGAWGDGENGAWSGAAYVFEQANGNWSQVAKLTPSDGAAGDEFGYAVSVSGTTAIVGAHRDTDNGRRSGSAYVFEQAGGTWHQVAKLGASDGAAEDHFGGAVAISAATAILGAYGDDDNGENSGSAYIFQRLPVSLTSNDPSEAVVSGMATMPWGQSTVVFSIDAVDDAVTDGTQVVTLTASATGYADAVATLDVADDDRAGLWVAETDGATVVTETGSTDTFTVALTAQPDGEVTITITGGDPWEVLVAPPVLKFTAEDWNQPQTVTVTGVDDYVVDGDQNTPIAIAVDEASTDAQFKAFPDQTVVATTLDDGYHGWQNPRNPLDVDADGVVKPLDALVLINWINLHQPETALPDPPEHAPPFVDVNGDNACTASDVLLVIHNINGQAAGAGEGESSWFATRTMRRPGWSSSAPLTVPDWSNRGMAAGAGRSAVRRVPPVPLSADSPPAPSAASLLRQPTDRSVWDALDADAWDPRPADLEEILDAIALHSAWTTAIAF
jgi:hypothetical protein